MLFGCCVPSKEYKTAEEAGFDFVEFSGAEIAGMSNEEFEQACEVVHAGRIPCLSLNSYCKGTPAIVGAAFDAEAVRTYAEHLCGRAAALGVKMIGIGAPNARRLAAGFDSALADIQCRTFLQITAGVAEAHGLQVNFEQLNPYACEYGTTTEKALSLVQDVGAGNLALVVDFYHRALAGERLCDFTGFQQLIRHTHISTCGTDLERGYPDMAELAYYSEIITSLKAAGYNETMSIEASTEDLPRQGPEALKMLRLADAENGGRT